MENQELCQAGALLAQRMEIGVESLRTGAAEVRTACNEVVGALQNIRDTTTVLHTGLEDVKRRADLNDKQTLDLGKQVEGHIGVHVGLERAGIVTGRRYAVAGVVGAVLVSFIACITFLQTCMP